MSDIKISELSFHEKLKLMELAEFLTRGYTAGKSPLECFGENYEAILGLISGGGHGQVLADGQKLCPTHLNPVYGDPETIKCPACGTDCYLAKSPKKSLEAAG